MKKLLLRTLSLVLASSMVVTPAMAQPKLGKKVIKKNPKATDGQVITKKRDKAIKKKISKKEFKRIDSLVKKNKRREKLTNFKFKKLKSAKARNARVKKMDAMLKSAEKNFNTDEKAAYKVWTQLTQTEKDAVVSQLGTRAVGYVPAVALAIGLVTLARSVVKEGEREDERGGNSVQGAGGMQDLEKALDF